MTIAESWIAIRDNVARACERAKRDPREVTIVAVSKKHPASAIREAAEAGAVDFGENYAQELASKQAEVELPIRWHFIGRLQSNKAKLVAGKVALVHAVDTLSLAQELGKRATQLQPILLAINVGGEASKGGIQPGDAALAKQLVGIANLRLDGLMTMPPPDEDPRPLFEELRAMRDRMQDELGIPLPVLSMGMSGDYETAIACGATHVRIGTAIFGAR